MKYLSTLLEVVGFGLIVAGVWQISPVAGWISAGVACVAVGVLSG